MRRVYKQRLHSSKQQSSEWSNEQNCINPLSRKWSKRILMWKVDCEFDNSFCRSLISVSYFFAFLRWSSTPTSNGSGLPDFHLTLARTYRLAKDRASAHQQYLRSGGATSLSSLAQPSDAPAFFKNQATIEAGQNIIEWASEGESSELDLFVTRAILQYLCIEDIASGSTLLKWFKLNQPSLASEPLYHFCEFLVETVQRSAAAAPLFDLLKHKYALAISRDPSLTSYLDRIGEIYFGRQVAKGFMESMLSGIGMANSSPSPPPPSSSSAPESAQEAPNSAMVTDVD